MKPVRQIAMFGFIVLVFSRLGKAQSVIEEVENLNDVPPDEIINNLGSDFLIPNFCLINPANTAGTQNFRLSEFHSKDGTMVPISIRGNIQILMEQLEVIRQRLNSPIIITSGYRSPQHNTNVGGTSQSRHLCGMAADFFSPGISNSTVQSVVSQLINEGLIIDGGLGRYNTFTHYDIGPSRRWDKR